MTASQFTHVPTAVANQSTNPYVGPRTFTEAEGRYFFGREREARDLAARIVSERLLLFYAQSGAGKSSLLNARVIPRLRDEEGFQVLPAGRVSGELPAGVAQVDNIYTFNLMASLDQSGGQGQRLAHATLSDFLAQLARETAVDAAGQRTARWVYKPERAAAPSESAAGQPVSGPRFVLVIDQFEEIITSHGERWQEREAFFRQLNRALLDDPSLWVVLSLREDFVAALDPYAELMANRLRARFYMERMGVAAALEAVRRPAELAGRPFAPGVAERLVDNLRQVRVPGQRGTVADQYVEPVQLQVVCYQLWAHLRGRQPGEITSADLAEAGDVDLSLAAFYESAIANVLSQRDLGVTEQQVRTWFSTRLITENGTRSIVLRNEQQGRTAGLPNAAVDLLARQFLLRTELRAGETWVELVHDRFLEPILRANRARETPLALDAEAWLTAGRTAALLYDGQKLRDGLRQAEQRPEEHNELEREFLRASQQNHERTDALRRRRMRIIYSVLGFLIGALLLAAQILMMDASNARAYAAALAQTAQAQAEAAADLAWQQANTLATAQVEAELAARVAISGRETAEAYRAVAVAALATTEANLNVALATERAPEPPLTATAAQTGAPAETPQDAGTLVATPAAASTPTPNLTVVAQQTQLAQVRATQTALAAPPTPTPCDLGAGPTFTQAWDRSQLGCPIAAESVLWTAYEPFERGWMLWRKDNDLIYTFLDSGGYRTFQLPLDQPRREISCPEAQAQGDPRWGFGQVWCENPDVRQQVGSALASEAGADRPLQEYENGFMVYLTERTSAVSVLHSGQWMVRP